MALARVFEQRRIAVDQSFEGDQVRGRRIADEDGARPIELREAARQFDEVLIDQQ